MLSVLLWGAAFTAGLWVGAMVMGALCAQSRQVVAERAWNAGYVKGLARGKEEGRAELIETLEPWIP